MAALDRSTTLVHSRAGILGRKFGHDLRTIFSYDLNTIWCVGRGRWVIRTSHGRHMSWYDKIHGLHCPPLPHGCPIVHSRKFHQSVGYNRHV